MNLVALLLFVLSNAVVHATILGDYVDQKEELPPHQCLLFTFSNGIHSVCSVTMLSPTRAVGANHCIQNPRLEKLIVEENADVVHGIKCGKERNFLRKASNLDKEWFDTDKNNVRAGKLSAIHDVAIFEVDRPFTLPNYPRLPNSTKELEDLLRQPDNCRVYGYGYDNQKKDRTLHGIVLNPARGQDDKPLVKDGQLILKAPSLDRGDSGGGIICKKDNEEILIGVNSNMRHPSTRAMDPSKDPSGAVLMSEGTLTWTSKLLENASNQDALKQTLPRIGKSGLQWREYHQRRSTRAPFLD